MVWKFSTKGLIWVPVWYVQNNIGVPILYSELEQFWLLLDLHKLHTCYLYLLQKPCLFARGMDTYVFPYQPPSHLGVVSTIDSSIVMCLLRAMSG
jgi:hypothetical protein